MTYQHCDFGRLDWPELNFGKFSLLPCELPVKVKRFDWMTREFQFVGYFFVHDTHRRASVQNESKVSLSADLPFNHDQVTSGKPKRQLCPRLYRKRHAALLVSLVNFANRPLPSALGLLGASTDRLGRKCHGQDLRCDTQRNSEFHGAPPSVLPGNSSIYPSTS